MASEASFHAAREMRDRERDDLIRSLEEQVAMWKAKYENIAKMYAQLRKEHLDLLGRFKDIQKKANAYNEASSENLKLQSAVKEKAAVINELAKDSAHWKAEYNRLKDLQLEETAQLKREISESHARLEQLSTSKGEETQSLIAKLHSQQEEHSSQVRGIQQEREQLKTQLNDLRADLERLQSEYNSKLEEIAVLQAGMDQSLMALQQLQDRNTTQESELLNKMDSLNLEHRSQMDKILGKWSPYE
jgi:chromosome segregation ATPase